MLAALGTNHVYLDFLFDSRSVGCGDSGESIILRLFARLAALWLVSQTLIVEEDLLTRGPNELFTAINASDRSILELRCLAVARLHCDI